MNKKSKKKVVDFDFRKIRTFNGACKRVGIDPKHLPDVKSIPKEFAKPIIAAYKLMIIFKAINNGWKPDWSNHSQWKYFPWFRVLSSGFGFSFSYCRYGHSNTAVGSRLCTDTSDKAMYIAEQFGQEYKDFFLYPEK